MRNTHSQGGQIYNVKRNKLKNKIWNIYCPTYNFWKVGKEVKNPEIVCAEVKDKQLFKLNELNWVRMGMNK